ncbi:MAG: 16S rRNA (guanine(966)-N(2))-methyltransferase RsmD [Candidatus Eisenbacteria bacterium]|nr:16S rRNA (guanine(966)-N(2))-methyltransferase RsmD [Candidatus Eisenbacteria bacterium]
MIRLSGGELRGRRLRTVRGRRCRPSQGRLREALFSRLGGRVRGARVLDLFAGSGALGLEALSRGAARAIFVERDRRMAHYLRENLAACGVTDRTDLWVRPVAAALPLLSAQGFDLVLADPPYDAAWPDAAAWDELGRILAAGGLMILEVARERTVSADPEAWDPWGARLYGDSRLEILVRK